jgi:hypothetical protein
MSNGRGLLSPIDSGLSTTEKMMTLYNLKQQKADRAAQQEQTVKANKLKALSTIIPYQAGNAKIASLQEFGKTLGVEFDMTKEKEIVDLIKRIGKQKDPNVAMQLMNAELEEYVLPEWLEAQRAQAEGQLQGEIDRQADMELGMLMEMKRKGDPMFDQLASVFQQKHPEHYMKNVKLFAKEKEKAKGKAPVAKKFNDAKKAFIERFVTHQGIAADTPEGLWTENPLTGEVKVNPSLYAELGAELRQELDVGLLEVDDLVNKGTPSETAAINVWNKMSQQAPKGKPRGASNEELMRQAQEAIDNGADEQEVRKRLIDWGVIPER